MSELVDKLIALAKNGNFVRLHGENLRVSVGGEGLSEADRDFLTSNKLSLVALFKTLNAGASDRLAYLSDSQSSLWLVDQVSPNRCQYNMLTALRLEGALDQQALDLTFQAIIDRHQVLRSTINSTLAGEPFQIVRDAKTFMIPRLHLTFLPVEKQGQALASHIQSAALQPFDLAADLMLRVTLLECSADVHVLVLVMHHIASDGWSQGVLMKEFSELYSAFTRGAANPLPELAIQYADYAHWQRRHLDEAALARHIAFWKSRLADLPDVHRLPLDRARPATQDFAGASFRQHLDTELQARLQALARHHDATLFMVLQAAFAVLLSRYCGDTDVVIGAPVANRPRAELAALVGFFTNLLVLRTDLADDPPFAALLRRTKRDLLRAYTHQQLPFEKLVQALRPRRSLRYSPLFQVMLSVQNNEAVALELPGLSADTLDYGSAVAKYDLMLNSVEKSDGLHLSWVYASALFDAATIAQMAGHFAVLLRSIVTTPDARVSALSLHSVQAQYDLKLLGEGAARPCPGGRCLHQLFARQVARRPDSVALLCGDQRLTFRQLDIRSNRLAHFLRAQDVTTDTLVGLALAPGSELVIGVLGILKAGGAYVPFDPRQPAARLRLMIDDSAPALLLTSSTHMTALARAGVRTLALDHMAAALAEYDGGAPPQSHQLETGLAYVMYTSGSSGRPKGVLIEHRGVVNLAYSLDSLALAPRPSAWGWVADCGFDASIQGLTQLALGRPLAVLTDAEKRDARLLRQSVEQHAIGVLDCTPGRLELWLAQDPCDWLPDLMVGGESITPVLWQTLTAHLHRSGRRAYNVYGPTECTVDSCWAPIAGELPNLGGMLPNLRGYVVDAGGQLAPRGCVGELWIGGVALARGYLHQAALTAERFVCDPFGGEPGGRLYRSGDLVRYLPDGRLTFVGRRDEQVKLRGFRIELGEIETLLAAHKGVASALVLVREDRRHLSAFVMPEPGQPRGSEVAGLSHYLQAHLPDYMVPAEIVVLDTWPLTANGKIDRRALLSLHGVVAGGDYRGPTTPAERRLTTIWARLLQVPAEQLSIDANFFASGGHSLLGVRLQAEIAGAFAVRLPLSTLFKAPTIRALGEWIDTAESRPRRQQTDTLVELRAGDDAALAPLVLVHPVGGGVACYRELVLALAPGRPIYGLQMSADRHDGIAAMAAAYCAALKQSLPASACVLGGWSVGGAIAQEMACRLTAEDTAVSLFMIDTLCPPLPASAGLTSSHEIGLVSMMAGELGITAADISAREQAALSALPRDDLLALLLQRGIEQGRLPPDTERCTLQQNFARMQSNSQAFHAFKPRYYNGRLHYFQARQTRVAGLREAWRQVSADVVWRVLEGDHYTLLREPRVAHLAAAVDNLETVELRLC
ncbi:amino acid adenylation domain-containing protein [Exilibacterium tricleocarpae]|uniref:Amino acid adenylation domain-containing protein n=1 Tax=Exilibacterium tricleocarpae TaxID=2591008 RepID=A0A545TFP3_9GAMM|nr:non-ribosomal peptide synthetase [Exilibacterium tricleocarpae]TQV76054.1 amino acid adenylation domain-containing protein [Exilibacterium tricleocarpae]